MIEVAEQVLELELELEEDAEEKLSVDILRVKYTLEEGQMEHKVGTCKECKWRGYEGTDTKSRAI